MVRWVQAGALDSVVGFVEGVEEVEVEVEGWWWKLMVGYVGGF